MARVSEIIEGMHEDGTLSELSNQWFGLDLTKKTSLKSGGGGGGRKSDAPPPID